MGAGRSCRSLPSKRTGHRIGAARVLGQSRKTGLFDDQERFAADIFQRMISTWGTLAMAVGGVAIGLFLEWRPVTLVLGAIVLEFALFSVYWNRFAEPEQAEGRERLIAQRARWTPPI